MAKRALGSGLNNLFGDINAVYEKNYTDLDDSMQMIKCDQIIPNPMQPRQIFNDESLRELANSIKENGLLQPIVVRQSESEGYILIAGERRLRATKLLQKEHIQAIVITAEDHKMRELALIENVQREDLNPIDLALCYQSLLKEHDLTQEKLAQKIHKSRTQITNTLRLLELSNKTQELLRDGKITQGHAKMLIGLNPKDEELALQSILGQKLNVRETENLAKNLKAKTKNIEDDKKNAEALHIESLQTLQEILKHYNIRSTVKNNTITLQCDEKSKLDILMQKLQ
ncbi:MAG: ParB/RepB/Spo0J family partition protein [Helicobacter trogontum]|uniref:ParB/RepB/Spo0J family partition protein n=1 Tax=Helicobacter trogontum TaxID=50960 RepID=UPI00242E1629|nr:ParB/RepB/Spo0J family partition protein [Helicobacter trogontum]MCI5786332.1 ParB/RepB/Spo0J family partition protein [Helicobacter trogontum]